MYFINTLEQEWYIARGELSLPAIVQSSYVAIFKADLLVYVNANTSVCYGDIFK